MSKLPTSVLYDLQSSLNILVSSALVLRPIIEKKSIDVKLKNKYDKCKNLKIDKVYKEIFTNFLCYCWVAKYVVRHVKNNAKEVGHYKFQHVLICHILKFTLTTCTTTYQNLNWEDFANFFDVINVIEMT
jgi:hypothetical protein